MAADWYYNEEDSDEKKDEESWVENVESFGRFSSW